MKYVRTLDEGIFLKRYKRFFADIEWQGQILTAHVANTGSLKGVNQPGQPCMFSHTENPARKLRQSLEAIKSTSGCWVGVNTATPNAVVREALERIVQAGTGEKFHPNWSHWKGFDFVKPEFKISAETRLDFVLGKAGNPQKHFIEVKNVTLADGDVAMFPDAETTRGQKHLLELMKLVEEGHTAEILFTIQRNDCEHFAPAHVIDREYGRLLKLALEKGVRITPLVVEISPQEVILGGRALSLKL